MFLLIATRFLVVAVEPCIEWIAIKKNLSWVCFSSLSVKENGLCLYFTNFSENGSWCSFQVSVTSYLRGIKFDFFVKFSRWKSQFLWLGIFCWEFCHTQNCFSLKFWFHLAQDSQVKILRLWMLMKFVGFKTNFWKGLDKTQFHINWKGLNKTQSKIASITATPEEFS